MKKVHIFLLVLLSVSNSVFGQNSKEVLASMKRVTIKFVLDKKGKPSYAMQFDGKPVILSSALGFILKDNLALDEEFELVGSEKKQVDESWKPVWGEVSSVRNHYEQLTIHLKQKKSSHILMNIVFRVFEDGIGFRYEFPQQKNLDYFIVSEELTEFSLAANHKAFWIPGDYDSNEYSYTVSNVNEINNKKLVNASTDIAVRTAPDPYSVQTPLMLKSKDGLYINIHEAALVNYPAMQLHVDHNTLKLKASLVPDVIGNKAYLHSPGHTPWRTIILSDKAADILESKLILNLNEPSVISDPSWIKPMKFVGVWWEMQTGKSTWSFAKSLDTLDSKGQLIPSGLHGANTANVKRYIDFASKNNIQGVLVEGWNTGWEDWFGNWKENVFDFVTPYPDFNISEVTRYASSKGVKMIMHNETSGSATNYERQLDTALKFMNRLGYTAVKTGYVGKIIPRGEHHDGQWMVNHYLWVAKKAAEHHIMLDAHEPVRPTGLQRTYPNWMACEASRGNEYNAFSTGNLLDHETILPFTRLIGGPMDYTPGIFKLKAYSSNPERQVHSTLAKQLALYITLYSPLQMAADLPENYEAHPDAFQFIKDVAVDWDDTKVLEAEPGEFITIARKAKGSESWFLGSITNGSARETSISTAFLTNGIKYKATIYADAENANWKDNPEAYKISHQIISSKTKLMLKMAPGGGCAISFKPIK